MVGIITRQCERCFRAVDDHELATVRRHIGRQHRLHLGCLTPLEWRRVKLLASGVPCIFCSARGLQLPELIDHFAAEHGRVLVNW